MTLYEHGKLLVVYSVYYLITLSALPYTCVYMNGVFKPSKAPWHTEEMKTNYIFTEGSLDNRIRSRKQLQHLDLGQLSTRTLV